MHDAVRAIRAELGGKKGVSSRGGGELGTSASRWRGLGGVRSNDWKASHFAGRGSGKNETVQVGNETAGGQGVTITRKPAPERVVSKASWTRSSGKVWLASFFTSTWPESMRLRAVRKSSRVQALVPVTTSSP